MLETELDRIERQIDIDATAERVWELISEPGWFINDGTIVEHTIEAAGEGVHVVHDPVHGAFTFETVELDRPRYAAFRWLGGDQGSTLIEFWIDANNGGGVTLRVAESGFAALNLSEEERRKQFDGNCEGWATELAAARAVLEAAANRG